MLEQVNWKQIISSDQKDQKPKKLITKYFYSIPSFDTSTFNNISDSILIHLFKFIWAASIEFSESWLQAFDFSIS